MVTAHAGRLQVLPEAMVASRRERVFEMGVAAIDRLLPAGLARGAVHEVLTEPGRPQGRLFATLLARAATTSSSLIAWSDPQGTLYPPALARWGIAMDQLLVLRPANEADQVWAVAECLRCHGIGATVACFGRLSRIGARRLQLAAEAGGGVGIFLRTLGGQSGDYAAATRWLLRSIPGERLVQQWELQLIHGHGGRLGQTVILEACRETHSVRVSERLVDRSVAVGA